MQLNITVTAACQVELVISSATGAPELCAAAPARKLIRANSDAGAVGSFILNETMTTKI